MALAIVLTVADLSTADNLTLFGMEGDANAIALASELLAAEMFKPRQNVIHRNYNTAEELFDGVNMGTESYVRVGDLVLWVETGKRELCLQKGWATI